eukprot:708846-Rhodomonas_salina.2
MDTILSTSDWQSSVLLRPSAGARPGHWHVPPPRPPEPGLLLSLRPTPVSNSADRFSCPVLR